MFEVSIPLISFLMATAQFHTKPLLPNGRPKSIFLLACHLCQLHFRMLYLSIYMLSVPCQCVSRKRTLLVLRSRGCVFVYRFLWLLVVLIHILMSFSNPIFQCQVRGVILAVWVDGCINYMVLISALFIFSPCLKPWRCTACIAMSYFHISYPLFNMG